MEHAASEATPKHGAGKRKGPGTGALGSEPSASRILGRPDLAQDSLTDLRLRSKQLKQEAAMVKRDLKNKKRQKARILRRVSRLATADIVQALLDRGVALREAASAESAAAASGSGDPAPDIPAAAAAAEAPLALAEPSVPGDQHSGLDISQAIVPVEEMTE